MGAEGGGGGERPLSSCTGPVQFLVSVGRHGRAGEGGGGRGADEPACVGNMCLSAVQRDSEERGVCLAATPKDGHKPIKAAPALQASRLASMAPTHTLPPSAPTMSAFISGGVIRPLAARGAAAVPLFVSGPI